MSDSLDFGDLAPIEIPVSIAGKKYVLREASGDAACRYRNALLKATKLGPEGKPTSIDGMADAEPLLVSLCLFEKTDTGHAPVTVGTVRSWPQRVQKKLFEKAQEISQLNEQETPKTLEEKIAKLQEEREKLLANGSAEAQAKNSPSATTAGSV